MIDVNRSVREQSIPGESGDDAASETATVYKSFSQPSVSDALSQSLPPLPRRNMVRNRPVVAPIQVAGSEMARLLRTVTQPATEERQPPRVLKIRLSRRRTFSEEDIWRMVYLRYNSLTDFSEVNMNYN